ncbi:hypothetical protein AURDEDRAFT_142434 [Auricularia subglabra TFB-10046 SS5]|nr:hypothetical protein AURDEDRAFT_142434 [Auricularia subglabra TFB-10046 SS5]
MTTPAPKVNSECQTFLRTQESIGLAFNVETGFFSAVAVLVLLGLYARNVWRNHESRPHEGWLLMRNHIDAYLLSLLFSDLLHALGSIMDLRWVAEGEVYCGDYCSAQGAIRNIGSTGVALATLAIAVHTFAVIFFRWIPPRSKLIPGLVIGAIWFFLIAFVALESGLTPNFYTPTPYWCWTHADVVARLLGQYVWLWLALFVSTVLYIILFFSLRGNITVDPDKWYRIKLHRSPLVATEDRLSIDTQGQPAAAEARSQAMSMLFYPLLYSILVLPLSIFRWVGYAMQQERPPRQLPFAVSIVSITVFGLSGLVNVALFMFTRPKLLLFEGRRRQNDSVTVRTFSFTTSPRTLVISARDGSEHTSAPGDDEASTTKVRPLSGKSVASDNGDFEYRMKTLRSIHTPVQEQDEHDSAVSCSESDVALSAHAV